MSQDQKPARIRAVAASTRDAVQEAQPAGTAGNGAAGDNRTTASPRPSILPGVLLYLIGCAIGGVALVAMPHMLAAK